MQIEPGAKLAHYEVLSPLGKGGMGEVYRAKDTKLGREVAIKVLPEEFTKDAERLARFEREARLLASLDHPHIAAIHGFEDVDGLRFLVMQLAVGEDLSDRLRRGPIPTDDAIEIAKQIAEALESAHEQGIVHRDLKPANIKIGKDGEVRILDFGLAKALETEESDDDFSNSPTMVRAATHAGVILGTAAYMSPEQARGKKVDKRADIWAFGVVLWEMLTGKRLFGGDTVSDTLASVLKEEPDWSELPDDVPSSVRRVIERCLAKNPKERLRDIGDARLQLVEPGRSDAGVASAGAAKSSRAPWAVAAVAVLVALVALLSTMKQKSHVDSGDTLYLRLPLEPAAHLAEDPSVAISPDGMTIVYRGQVDGRTRLFVRYLDSPDVTIIPGSEEASLPAFSPDGAAIVFSAQGKIMRASLSGGEPTLLAQESSVNGLCWTRQRMIVFNTGWATGLKRISESGGSSEQVTVAEPGTSHIWTHCLPDGDHVLFTRWSGESVDAISIQAVSLSSGEIKEVIRDAKAPKFLPSGVLTFLRGTTLMAVRFDPETLEVRGDPVPMISKVSHNPGDLGASYDLSSTGTLVYVPAPDTSDPRGFWVDLEGKEVGVTEPKLREWIYPDISPDGTKLLVTKQGPAFQICIIDLEGGPRTQLTNRHDNGEAHWTPDGQVVYFSNRNGRYEILRQTADGTGQPEILVGGHGAFPIPQDVTADGRYLLFSDIVESDRDLWYIELEGDRDPKRILASPGSERLAQFSPDGRYVAYQSTVSGRNEIYVTPFPGPGTSWQISTEGGLSPRWSPDGRALYFHDGRNHVMHVATTLAGTFRAGAPEVLFERNLKQANSGVDFDVSPDGTRLLFVEADDLTRYQRLNVVLNWSKVLEEKLPGK